MLPRTAALSRRGRSLAALAIGIAPLTAVPLIGSAAAEAASSSPTADVAAATAAPYTGGWATTLTGTKTLLYSSVGGVSASFSGTSLTVSFAAQGKQFSLVVTPPSGGSLRAGTPYGTTAGASISFDGQACSGGFYFDALAGTPSVTSLGIEFGATCGALAISSDVALNLPNDGGAGYYIYQGDGKVYGFGNNDYLLYLGNLRWHSLNDPIITMATTPDGGGYWMAGADGGIYAYGDAAFYGSMGGRRLNKPIVGMTSTRDGEGYWEVASDGGIFAFGDAVFYGSMGGKPLNKPIVGIAAAPDGKGYWEVASDGGIFAFGDAVFYGSMGGKPLNKPIVGIAVTPGGGGYWEVASDGGIFAFGNAQFYGSTGNFTLNKPIESMIPTSDGQGYWFVASDGGVFAFGDAGFAGSLADQGLITTTQTPYTAVAGLVHT